MRPATPMPGRIGWCGRMAARWSTTRTTSSSIRPETIAALEYAKQLYATFIAGHAVVARPEQQQGVPRRPDSASPTTASRSTRSPRTPRTRRSRRSPRTWTTPSIADRPGRQAHRAPLIPPGLCLQVHEISERGEGVSPLHVGEGAVRTVAGRLQRLHHAAAQGLRTTTRSGRLIRRTRRSATPRSSRSTTAIRASSAPHRRR